jgi:conjugative transfer region protein TrbK
MAHSPSRTGRIAIVAALAGMMMAVAIMVALTDRASPAKDTQSPPAARDERLEAEMARCATTTMPDAGCEAAWAANRRRFFGRDKDSRP